MIGFRTFVVCCVAVVCAGAASAQDDAIRTVDLGDGLAMLVGRGGNVGVSYGSDGVLLVDDKFAPMAPAIRRAVGELAPGAVRWVLNTHWHGDHTGGNEQLLEAFPNLEVYGHRYDDGRIFGQTQRLDDGDVVHVGHHKARILFIPGHTTGSIAYHFRDDVFTGDALFIAGCGRVFEGNPVMMHNSLQRLTALHPQTRVWVGHEYTVANLTFAQTVEPENQAIQKALKRAQAARAEGLPTIPSSVELELQINPFLRASSPEVFAERRALKDAF